MSKNKEVILSDEILEQISGGWTWGSLWQNLFGWYGSKAPAEIEMDDLSMLMYPSGHQSH